MAIRTKNLCRISGRYFEKLSVVGCCTVRTSSVGSHKFYSPFSVVFVLRLETECGGTYFYSIDVPDTSLDVSPE